MQFDTSKAGNYCIVHLHDHYLDHTNSNEFKNALKSLIEENQKHLVVDMGKVKIVTSSGFGALAAVLRSTQKAQGSLAIGNLNTKVAALFQITKMDAIFDIYADINAITQQGAS